MRMIFSALPANLRKQDSKTKERKVRQQDKTTNSLYRHPAYDQLTIISTFPAPLAFYIAVSVSLGLYRRIYG